MASRKVAHSSVDDRRVTGGQARAASFTIAARNNGFSSADTRDATMASVMAYRGAMASFAQMRTMDIWYAHLDEDELKASLRSTAANAAEAEKGAKKAARHKKAPKKYGKRAEKQGKTARKEERRAEKTLENAHTRDSLQALSKLGELVDGRYRIVSQPPIVVPGRDLAAAYGLSPSEVGHGIREQFRAYRATLRDDRRQLLERFEVAPVALTFYARICGWTLARAHARSGGTQSSLRSTWAQAMRSTHRSPTSPGGTPIRTSGTIRTS